MPSYCYGPMGFDVKPWVDAWLERQRNDHPDDVPALLYPGETVLAAPVVRGPRAIDLTGEAFAQKAAK